MWRRGVWLGVAVGLGVAAGALWGTSVAPSWVSALTGPQPRGFWYLSRSTGWVGYGLLWLATCLGLATSGRVFRGPRAGALVELHRFTAALALWFVTAHAFALLADGFLHTSLPSVLVPFQFPERRPWVGLGQLAAYTAAVVYASVFVRRWSGYRAWRRVHYAAFGAYGLATLHLLGAGTDVGPWTGTVAVGSAAVVCALVCARAWEAHARGEVTRA